MRLSPDRVAWVDVAKGASVVLVVLHHTLLALTATGYAPRVLLEASTALGTLRMPLFFLASGLFAGRALAGPWGPLLRRRVALFAWVYVLWCALRLPFFSLLAHGLDLAAWPSPAVLVHALWQPSSSLWFVHALAVFSLAGRLLRPVPVPVRLGGAAVLSAVVGSGLVPVDSYAWRSMGAYLVFFLLGAHGSGALRRAVARLTRPAAAAGALALGAAFAVATAAVHGSELARVPGVRLGVGLVAVAAAVLAAAAVGDGRLAAVPRRLGTRTLDVYLVHGLLLAAALHVVVAVVPAPAGGPPPLPAAAGLTVALVVGCVTGSLAVGRALRRAGAGWLFALPAPLSGRRPATSATAGRGAGVVPAPRPLAGATAS
ncbi:acyltransferase family protein [Cellulomonas endophytica]|uniref:acyltransferase family protein n=1 Tax=Cellulomonas endophytica TaxID=2494735 RepID=UPI0013E8F658|nr:acyltransferase family protein [Cellulomonas endophytica]